MCFHSPYAGFWHLYTFFKLSSISKEINSWLYVLRKAGLVHGRCRGAAEGGLLRWEVTARGGRGTETRCSERPWKEAWTVSKHKKRKWLLLRETNCLSGQQAVISDFLPSAPRVKATEWGAEAAPPVTRCPCPGRPQPGSPLGRVAPVALGPVTPSAPLCLRSTPGTRQDASALVGVQRPVTKHVFLVAAKGHSAVSSRTRSLYF